MSTFNFRIRDLFKKYASLMFQGRTHDEIKAMIGEEAADFDKLRILHLNEWSEIMDEAKEEIMRGIDAQLRDAIERLMYSKNPKRRAKAEKMMDQFLKLRENDSRRERHYLKSALDEAKSRAEEEAANQKEKILFPEQLILRKL